MDTNKIQSAISIIEYVRREYAIKQNETATLISIDDTLGENEKYYNRCRNIIMACDKLLNLLNE